MKDTLRQLSELQIEALDKGVSFDLALDYNGNKIPIVTVNLHYSVTGNISKGYVFSTTFSDNLCKSKQERRMAELTNFITTITTTNETD